MYGKYFCCLKMIRERSRLNAFVDEGRYPKESIIHNVKKST